MKFIFSFLFLILFCLSSQASSKNSSLTFEASKYEMMDAMEERVRSMKSSIYAVFNSLDCDGFEAAYKNLKYTIRESGMMGMLKTVKIKTTTSCPTPLLLNGTQTHFTEWVNGTNYYSYTVRDQNKTYIIKTTEKSIIEE